MFQWTGYDEGFADGWEEGRGIGFQEGYAETARAYEERISALWAELQTLNARIDYLEKHTGLIKGE